MPSKTSAVTSPTLTKGKVKKLARIAATQNEKQRLSKLRDASTKHDLLEGYPGFRKFERDGVAALLEGLHGCDLASEDVDACLALQAVASGAAYDEVAARNAIQHEESRVLLMRAPPTPPEAPTSPPPPEVDLTSSTFSSGDGLEDEWDFVPEAADMGVPLKAPGPLNPSASPIPSAEASPPPTEPPPEPPAPGSVIGYLHLQFCVANRAQPLLCVLNMQLAPAVTGKGLGKFALQLVELMALQHGMELVMMYMVDGEVKTMRLSRNRPSPGAKAGLTAAASARTASREKRSSPTKADKGGAAMAESDEAFELIQWPSPVVEAGGHALCVRA